MNGKKAKRISRRARNLLIEWVKSLLPEEEAEKVNLQNIQSLLPKETHYFANNRVYLNAYSFKWIKNGIKRILKLFPATEIETITMEDIKCHLNFTKKTRQTRTTDYKVL